MKSDQGLARLDVAHRGAPIERGSFTFTQILVESPLGAVLLVAAVCGALLVHSLGKNAPDEIGQPVQTTAADFHAAPR